MDVVLFRGWIFGVGKANKKVGTGYVWFGESVELDGEGSSDDR